jgi:predicted  nucleic acid-binding Zn-ribbon protein
LKLERNIVSEPISMVEIDGRIQALSAQRNEANDKVVILHGALVATQKKLDEALAKIEELETKPELP